LWWNFAKFLMERKMVSVFSTAFELRGADLPSFSCAEKKLGEIFFFVKNVLLMKFDGL
jgi:hypothetical protein